MKNTIYTIGGYGYSREAFFEKLDTNQIDLFVDVRQRRGMRGSLYSFLNSTALQDELARHGIAYLHLKELAPTTRVRQAQKIADSDAGMEKRQREQLSDEFRLAYREEVLALQSARRVLGQFGDFTSVCLFCVERPAVACHRSIVADWLSAESGLPIVDL